MDKNAGIRTERTKTEVDVISQEVSKEENLDARPKQLCAKDTSHGRVSEMLIKGDGIKKANILYRPDKVMNGKGVSAPDIPTLGTQIGWKRKTVIADITRRKEKAKKVQSQEKNAHPNIQELQGTRQRGEGETDTGQGAAGTTQADTSYSPKPPPATSPGFIYPAPMHIIAPVSPSGEKAGKIIGKGAIQDRNSKTIDKTAGKAINNEKIRNIGGGINKGETVSKSGNETLNMAVRRTSCHDGRKLSPGMVKQDSMLAELPGKTRGRVKAQAKGKSITYMAKGGEQKPGTLFMKKAGIGNVKISAVNINEKSVYFHQKPGNEEKSGTSCHDGRKLEDNAGRKEPGAAGEKQGSKAAQGRKKVESSLCASYRAIKKTGGVAASTARGAITTAAAVSGSMSKLSEDGGELQAITEAGLAARDTVGYKVSGKHAIKKAGRDVKKYSQKRDTLLERKAEIKQFTAKKKLDGTPLSGEEIAMLEKKLGIASKKDKGKRNVSDKKNKKLQKVQKANSRKIKKTENKLKNIPKSTNKKLWKQNVSAQMRNQARNYAIRRLSDPNNEAGGTGLGGMLLSLVKTGGAGFSKKALKAIGNLLLKIAASILPVILAAVIVPIVCLLLVVGIAGGSEEENQAHAQETSTEADYYLPSLNILYGHANSTITDNANIMKWKAKVKRELIKKGIDKSWTDMVLCMMWQESKGLGNDIMQSGGATPDDSIRAGISVLKSALEKCAQYQSSDIKLVLYCYNYGPGFADYIYKEWDGVCSEEAAQARTDAMLASHPEWSVYGDPKYAQHVLQNYVFEENPDLAPDSGKWCEADKNNVSKCTLTPVTSYACKFIGNKYVWGGTSLTNGCDCSGYTQQVYMHFGINIPRTSREQSQSGKKINSLAEAKPGDLLFYADGGTVSHVALYLGNNTIVHASNSQPYPSGGIKTTSPANYRTIVVIRRYSK